MQRQVHFHALLHGWIGKPLGDPVAVGFVGKFLPISGRLYWLLVFWTCARSSAAFAGERHPAPEQVAGRPHLGGIDVGLREHAAAEQHGNLVGVDLVVFGLAAMDGLHRERMTEDKRDAFLQHRGRRASTR